MSKPKQSRFYRIGVKLGIVATVINKSRQEEARGLKARVSKYCILEVLRGQGKVRGI